jgi:hypothetical protein
VQDDSLIDEMRAAVRADRERAEARRQEKGPTPLGPSSEPTPQKRAGRPKLFARLARFGR